MPVIAYLANTFPSATEPYVMEEIQELRRRGTTVISGSVRRSAPTAYPCSSLPQNVITVQSLKLHLLIRAVRLSFRLKKVTSQFLRRALLQGRESPIRRIKAVLHTALGCYYAALLQDHAVDHIHVHHGYFGSWIAMVAASLLEVPFSLTLHGSDLLLNDAYLDEKLIRCRFCVTISAYNRDFVLKRFPGLDPNKIVVSRLGVKVPPTLVPESRRKNLPARPFTLLSVGRLHPVKNHAFLIGACALLAGSDTNYDCQIAGDGAEKNNLDKLIGSRQLQRQVRLLGHQSNSQLDALYRNADLCVLTSISEGIPLVLMEAMSHGTLVLAPAITGIPELVIPGVTGFLYEPGNMRDFVARLRFLYQWQYLKKSGHRLDWIRHAARIQLRNNFNRQVNLKRLAEIFLQTNLPDDGGSTNNEGALLQQI